MAEVQEDKGTNPLLNNHFLLRVDATYDLPCFKISVFTMEKEYENIQAGGINDYVFLREKPVSKPATFHIERYIGTKFFDPLPVGTQPKLPIVLYISQYCNDFTNPRQTFSFSGCTVLKKEYGELDAQKSGLMIEKTTIAYQQVKLEQSTQEEQEVTWKFDTTGKKYQGVGKRHAMLNQNEVRKSEMEKQSHVWPLTRSARTISNSKR